MSETVDIHGDEVVSAKTLDFGLMRRLLPYALRHWPAFARSMGVLAGILACELVMGLLWKLAIDGPATSAVEQGAAALGIDPAIVAGPFLITLSDISGAAIFMLVAHGILASV